MESRDLDEANVREAIARSKVENIKDKLQVSEKEARPRPSPEQIAYRLKVITKQVGSHAEAVKRLERVLKGDDLTDIKYLLQGVLCARSICRIVVRTEGASPSYGTGFLIAPGVLITNYHVWQTEADVQVSQAEFNYELNLQGRHMTPTTFLLRTSPKPILNKDLDLAIAAVEPLSEDGKPVEHFNWLKLSAEPGKAFIGEYLTIIQHPRGEPKQVCVRENRVLKYAGTGPYVWYQTDTDAGSSGSPVFNNSWEVVALHHCSIPNTNEKGEMLTWDGKPVDSHTDSEEVAWIANEGVRISKIVEYLQGLDQHPLAQAVLTAADPPLAELPTGPGLSTGPGTGVGQIQVQSDVDGVTRILVPIEITVKVGVGGSGNAGSVSLPKPPSAVASDISQPAPSASSTPVPSDGEFEKVVVNQMNYHERNGYDPNFLGKGLVVPLPIVTRNAQKTFGNVLHLKGGKDGARKEEHELKYWNYSVVMNQKRKLAYFSAANVDSANFAGDRDAAGDTWYEDTRIDPADQLSNRDKFYGEPFDKGHLTSRSDLQWGTAEAAKKLRMTREDLAKRNGDDSYHWTNCSPQHGAFNRASTKNGLWRRLELAAISTLSAKNVDRFCIINGPVFDAPKSSMANNQVTALNLKGLPEKDVTYRGVQIPRLFFKIIAYSVKSKDGPDSMELRAKAFVVSQENLLNTDEIPDIQERFSEREISIYQVALPALQELTGLDFGTLCDSDWFQKEEAFSMDSGQPVEIRDESDLVF